MVAEDTKPHINVDVGSIENYVLKQFMFIDMIARTSSGIKALTAPHEYARIGRVAT